MLMSSDSWARRCSFLLLFRFHLRQESAGRVFAEHVYPNQLLRQLGRYSWRTKVTEGLDLPHAGHVVLLAGELDRGGCLRAALPDDAPPASLSDLNSRGTQLYTCQRVACTFPLSG